MARGSSLRPARRRRRRWSCPSESAKNGSRPGSARWPPSSRRTWATTRRRACMPSVRGRARRSCGQLVLTAWAQNALGVAALRRGDLEGALQLVRAVRPARARHRERRLAASRHRVRGGGVPARGQARRSRFARGAGGQDRGVRRSASLPGAWGGASRPRCSECAATTTRPCERSTRRSRRSPSPAAASSLRGRAFAARRSGSRAAKRPTSPTRRPSSPGRSDAFAAMGALHDRALADAVLRRATQLTLMSILRGCACSALGIRRFSTPCFSSAETLPVSSSFDSVNTRRYRGTPTSA